MLPFVRLCSASAFLPLHAYSHIMYSSSNNNQEAKQEFVKANIDLRSWLHVATHMAFLLSDIYIYRVSDSSNVL